MTSDSKLASCFIHKVHCDSLVKNGYYILVGARIQTRSDVTYIDIMESTKVSVVKMTMKQIGLYTLSQYIQELILVCVSKLWLQCTRYEVLHTA